MNELWTIDKLSAAGDPAEVGVWATPAVIPLVRKSLPRYALLTPLEPLPATCSTLIVVGGGTLIDEAKKLRRLAHGSLRLVAIPSIWGSGAERSAISVLNRNGRKEICVNAQNTPDIYVLWQDAAKLVPTGRARYASGDVWAHALEGFLSPLAAPELQEECALLLRRMQDMAFTYHPAWLEISGLACVLQSRSSVGLVHGIAHTLEGVLKDTYPRNNWHHARLCSIFLWPVMKFNCESSQKFVAVLKNHLLDPSKVLSRAGELFDAASYNEVKPLLRNYWGEVLRDPCTRTNSVLVRPGSLAYFEAINA
jgi:alcohol dehydrogenase class IV